MSEATATPCKACPWAWHRQPMLTKTPEQIIEALRLAGFRCETFTLRHDVSAWHAQDSVYLYLAQARGTLQTLEEYPEIPDFFRHALGGVVALTEHASAALAVLMASVPAAEQPEKVEAKHA
jgi:hypothetical protein